MEELDPDFILDEQNQYNNSWSNFEGESLDFNNSSFSPTAQQHSFGSPTSLADEFDDLEQTPVRNNGGAQEQRMSLALELENVSSAGRSSNRDLMKELGIEGDEEELEQEDYDSDEEEVDERFEQHSRDGLDKFEPAEALGKADQHLDIPRLSPFRSPSAASSSSLHSSHFEETSSTSNQSSPHSRDDADLLPTPVLELDLSVTTSFLTHLRQHTNPRAHAEPQLNPSLPKSPLAIDTFSMSESPIDYTDRQPFVEALATSLVDRMYELAKVREEQVRELMEMEKLVSRNDLNWQKVLGSLDDIAELGSLSVDGRESGAVRSNGVEEVEDSTILVATGSVEAGEVDRNTYSHGVKLPQQQTNCDRISSQLNSFATTSSHLPISTIRIELSDLQNATSLLITALSTLSEAAQFNQAVAGESNRKLKSLKSHLVTVKEEFSSFARAEEFIKEYEEIQGKVAVEKRKGRFSLEARSCLREVQGTLDEGWKKANSIFKEVV